MIEAIKALKISFRKSPPLAVRGHGTARWAPALPGFQEIRVPIFETMMLLDAEHRATTDIVEKRNATFADRWVLPDRPEGTAGNGSRVHRT